MKTKNLFKLIISINSCHGNYFKNKYTESATGSLDYIVSEESLKKYLKDENIIVENLNEFLADKSFEYERDYFIINVEDDVVTAQNLFWFKYLIKMEGLPKILVENNEPIYQEEAYYGYLYDMIEYIIDNKKDIKFKNFPSNGQEPLFISWTFDLKKI